MRPRDLWRRLASWSPLVAVAVFLVAAVGTGLPGSAAARELGAVTITQVLPGVVAWRALRPRAGWWVEDIAMGLALGAAVAVGGQALAGTLGAAWVAAVAGPLLGAGVLAVPALRRRVLSAHSQPLPLWWGPAIAAVSLTGLVTMIQSFSEGPITWDRGFRISYVDLPFHLALAGELAHRGPSQMPYVEGEPLNYHWFAHAWAAQVAGSSGTGLDQVLYRFFPAFLAVAAVVVTATTAVRLSGRASAGPLAAVLAFPVADLDAFGAMSHRYLVSYRSPTLTLSLLFVPAVITVLSVRWREGAGRETAPVLAGLAFVAAGTKGSALPVLVAGGMLAATVAVVTRLPERKRVVVDAGIMTLSLVASAVVIFAGASGGLQISLSAGLDAGLGATITALATDAGAPASAAVVLVVVLVSLARGAGMLGAVGQRALLHNPMIWLLGGAGLAGTLALLVFTQPGASQQYFALNARQPLAIGSALGLLVLAEGLRRRDRRLAWTCGLLGGALATPVPVALLGRISDWREDAPWRALGALVIAAGCVLAVGAAAGAGAGQGRLRAAALAALTATSLAGAVPYVLEKADVRDPYRSPRVASTAPGADSADQVAAARWLRDNSRRDDVVATNRHCRADRSRPCDPRRFFVAAYAERRVLVEGWAYTPTSAAANDAFGRRGFWDPAELAANDGFFRAPSAAGAEFLASHHVRWLYVDKTMSSAATLEPYARLRHTTRWAAVYELLPPSSVRTR